MVVAVERNNHDDYMRHIYYAPSPMNDSDSLFRLCTVSDMRSSLTVEAASFSGSF